MFVSHTYGDFAFNFGFKSSLHWMGNFYHLIRVPLLHLLRITYQVKKSGLYSLGLATNYSNPPHFISEKMVVATRSLHSTN